MALRKCKRMTVHAMGKGGDGELAVARNGNRSEWGCTGEAGKCGCIHAEINLLRKLPRPELVVLSHSPCLNCARELYRMGVGAVYYLKEYRLLEGVEYLVNMGISVYQLTDTIPIRKGDLQ